MIGPGTRPFGDVPGIISDREERHTFGSGNSITTAPDVSTNIPQRALACYDCDVFYDLNQEWEYCPRCGSELTTIKKE